MQETGTDQVLLAQRAAFLRPDSIVGVVLLSDENDCSLDPSQGGLLLQSAPFFKPTVACEADPNDACCTSCALPTPVGCSADPACENQPKYSAVEDQPNLKCFDQKRRYGIDFHYPMGRYVNALSSELIDPAAPNFDPTEGTIQNPLFAGDRQPGHVVFTAITGVPWQDLATDASDPASPLKSSAQMEADGSWGWLTGENGGAPLDPFMRASIEQRSGNSPATGESTTSANGINGGDRTIPENDNLQYSCIFPLQTQLQGGTIDCDCVEGVCDSPICDGEVQVAGKAYPGLRQLQLARSLGNQSIVGSICPPAITELPSGESSPLAGRSYAQPLEEMAARLGALLPDAE